MRSKQVKVNAILLAMLILALMWCVSHGTAIAGDLKEIKHRGVLRHLGITYAHFVHKTPKGYDGLDVEVMKLFAEHLGVSYQLINTTWEDLFTDLTGRRKKNKTQTYHLTPTEKIKEDIIANGLTILPWRQEIVNYSRPTFPTGVWLIAPANSTIKPITPTGNISLDINKVKALLKGISVLTMDGTCLSAELYNLEQTKAEIKCFTQSKTINDIAPAMLTGMAETALMDIPDAMVALQKWPGEVKIIGPVSEGQVMGVAVRKSSTQLLDLFNEFFKQIWADGTYHSLVEKYYPSYFLCFGNFFDKD